MKRFKYDVVKLIEAVRDRPCLWNKHVENYKDRVERREAWIEIFNILDQRYEEMSSDDQRLTNEIIISKWTNIRDTFVKTIKKKSRKGKHYILYDNLKFLLEIIPEKESNRNTEDINVNDETETQETSSLDDARKSNDTEIIYEDSDAVSEEEILPTYKASSSKRKKLKKETAIEEINESPTNEDSNIDFVSVNDHRIMNEDEAFFASLLPSVVKYSEEERLEFRIEVLAVMKRISDKRKISY